MTTDTLLKLMDEIPLYQSIPPGLFQNKERITEIIRPTNWTDKELNQAFKEVEKRT